MKSIYRSSKYHIKQQESKSIFESKMTEICYKNAKFSPIVHIIGAALMLSTSNFSVVFFSTNRNREPKETV